MENKQKAGLRDSFKFYSAQSLWLAFMGLHRHDEQGKPVTTNVPLQTVYKDILSILNRLYRARRLLMDHLRVLHFYGRKGRAPRSWVHKEMRAHTLWKEALAKIEPILIRKGIVTPINELELVAAE